MPEVKKTGSELLQELRDLIYASAKNNNAGTTGSIRGTTKKKINPRLSTVIIKELEFKQQPEYKRVNEYLNTKNVKDLNSYGVGSGSEYNFWNPSNLSGGFKGLEDYKKYIKTPIERKIQYYAIINSSIKANILEDFKKLYNLDWYSGQIPSTELDITTAISKRLADINLHLSGLQIMLGNYNISGLSLQVMDTSEIIVKTSLLILSIIPLTRPVGIVGGMIIGNNDKKRQLQIAEAVNNINRDAQMLELEAKALIELYNSKAEKPKFTDDFFNDAENSRSANGLDSFLKNPIETIKNNPVYLIYIAAPILIIYLIVRRNKKRK